MPINQQRIALMHLRGGQKSGNWANHIPLNSSFQVPSSVSLVSSFMQQELAAFLGDPKQERPRCRIQYALLNIAQFDLQHFVEFLALEGMEHHQFVQAIHKLRREPAPGRFYCCPLHLFLQSCSWLVVRLDESHASLQQIRDLATSQV